MAGSQKSFVGIDIGGSKIEAILWRAGKIFVNQKIKTPKNRAEFLRKIFQLIENLSLSKPVAGIGISSAGAMDIERGMILNSPNIKYLNGLRLADLIHKKFNVPARLENDANCFLRAEMRFGQARGKNNVVALTLGTGVGGALLVEGNLVRGKHGAAGELGHMIISANKEGKGEFLFLEDLISSHGFARLGIKNPLEIQNRAFAGDRKALAIYKIIGANLGAALVSFVNIFDPEIIILGGGIAKASKLFLSSALAEMKNFAMLPPRLLPPVKISKLKYAGALGAVSLFLPRLYLPRIPGEKERG